MRQLAVGAVLYSILRIVKIPAALISKSIQRTVTEQTVEIFRICPFMAWKIFAFSVAEKRIVLVFPIFFAHILLLYKQKSAYLTPKICCSFEGPANYSGVDFCFVQYAEGTDATGAVSPAI